MGRENALAGVLRENACGNAAMALMAAENRCVRGVAPGTIEGVEVVPGSWCLGQDAFQLRTADGIVLHYAQGAGVIVDAPESADPRDVRLWSEGTLYAAVAALNGLFPLHASAIAHEGRVFAFTGPAGAGKSTLVAALGQAGFAHFCDDTLILETVGAGPPIALPGHKRPKLWPEGAELAGVRAGERVASDYAKHFVDPAVTVADPLPLAALFVLGESSEAGFGDLGLAERIGVLEDDHYTAELWRQAGRKPREQRFAELASLARRIPMQRFERPLDRERFAETVTLAKAQIRSWP